MNNTQKQRANYHIKERPINPIAAYCWDNRITQMNLADMMGISRATANRWCTMDDFSAMPLGVAAKLCKYGINVLEYHINSLTPDPIDEETK